MPRHAARPISRNERAARRVTSTSLGVTGATVGCPVIGPGITSGRSRPPCPAATEVSDTLTYLVGRRQEPLRFLDQPGETPLGLLSPAAPIVGEKQIGGRRTDERAHDAPGQNDVAIVHVPSTSGDMKSLPAGRESRASRAARAARPGSSMLCLRSLL